VSNSDQTEDLSLGHGGITVQRLKSLQREYNENARQLGHPIDLADLERLKERREAILREARELAQTLNISEPQWYSLAV
jgi:uncharacterized membrane protein (DUF106 family)